MKKTISKILAAVMMTSAITAVNVISTSAKEPSYTDVPSEHWAFNLIEAITEHKAFDGYDDGTFKPENQITHEEFTKTVISLVCGAADTVNGYQQTGKDIYHMWSAWAQPYLNKSIELGIITSDDTALMAVDTPISRKEMAQIIVKAMEYQGKTLNADINVCGAAVTDWAAIPDTYKPYVAKAYTNGIIDGYEDNSFRADGHLTRAEAAAVIARMMGYTTSGTHKRIEDMTQEEKNQFALDFFNKHPDYEYGQAYGERFAGDLGGIKVAQEQVNTYVNGHNTNVNLYLDTVQKYYADEIGDISYMTQEERNQFALDFFNKHPDYRYGQAYGERFAGDLGGIKVAQEQVNTYVNGHNNNVNLYLDTIQKHYGDAIYED